MANLKLSAVVLTKNEEENIASCLKSLSFCDQIVVIDDFSSDKTVKIAQELGAVVFQRPLAANFANQRNFALRQAQGEWVLFVDADEEVSATLKDEILEKIGAKNNRSQGYYLKRKNYFLGKLVGEDKILRLARKSSGQWRRRVHETWLIKGKVGKLKNDLIHQTAESVSGMLAKINFYSSLHARANYEEGKKSNLLKIIFFPALKFMSSLLAGRDLVFSFMQSLHSFLAWSELWLLQKKLIGKSY